ncbi:MAG: hypothetical protein JXR76_15340 [Deltaproteobacteria bacterium]|nr:hypothetical protein [Deltaproteobacteria bacterium]
MTKTGAIGVIAGLLFIVYVLILGGQAVRRTGVFVFDKVDTVVSWIVNLFVWGGFVLVGLFIVAVVIDLLFRPVWSVVNAQLKTRRAIQTCSLPSLGAFRDLSGVTGFSALTAKHLREVFYTQTGRLPCVDTFRNCEVDYLSYRGTTLRHFCMGVGRPFIESYFSKVHGIYLAGTLDWLTAIVDGWITGEKRYKRMACTGMAIHFLSFGKFGYNEQSCLIKQDLESVKQNRVRVMRLLWQNAFSVIGQLESYVPMDVEIEAEKASCRNEAVCQHNRVSDVQTTRLLPPAVKAEEANEDVCEDDESERSDSFISGHALIVTDEEQERKQKEAVAIELFDAATSICDGDGPEWNDIPKMLTESLTVLTSSGMHFYPNKDELFEAIAHFRMMWERFPEFESAFAGVMQLEGDSSEVFSAPWMNAAISDLDGNIAAGISVLKRNAARHFLTCESPLWKVESVKPTLDRDDEVETIKTNTKQKTESTVHSVSEPPEFESVFS